jgi:hypothetical protein
MSHDLQIVDMSDATTKGRLLTSIAQAEGLHWLEFRRCRQQRTLQQNKWLWSGIYPIVAEAISELWGETMTAEDCHVFLKERFLSRPIVNRHTGEVKGKLVGSTVELDTAGFSSYVDAIIKFAAEQLSIDIPPPRSTAKTEAAP